MAWVTPVGTVEEPRFPEISLSGQFHGEDLVPSIREGTTLVPSLLYLATAGL